MDSAERVSWLRPHFFIRALRYVNRRIGWDLA
jgi:hypothetical protein